MTNWDDNIFDNNENPYEILLQELERSSGFFQLLSETLDDSSFQQQAQYNIKTLEGIKAYIINCNENQLDELLNRIDDF